MSENINFIPATALPVAEGEEVSVLCLENGAMKQKPASGLGGGTIVICHTQEASDSGSTYSFDSVPQGTFASLKAMINGGDAVQVWEVGRFAFTGESGDVIESVVRIGPSIISYYCEKDGVPEYFLFDTCFPYMLLSEDRIMTMDEFEQEFGGGE